MPANDRMPCVWSRRSLLVALTVGLVTALTGCRVRLEDDAPRNLNLPTRSPIADEQALLLARRDALRLRDLAAGLGPGSNALTELLATVHGLQAQVFESVLRSGGVPPAVITAGPTPVTPTATPTATATATATTLATATTGSTTTAGGAPSVPAPPSGISELVDAEAEGVAAGALSDLAGISRDRVALLATMAAQRAAAVRLLGGRLPSADTPAGSTAGGNPPHPIGGTLIGPTGEVAADQLAAIRSAVYGFEVVVAQTDPSHRTAAVTTLGALRASSSELQRLAGKAAKPIALGYALPFPVATPASALRLATHVMTALRAAIASQLPAVAGDAEGLTGTVQVLTDVCVDAVTWRVPLTAFPGLTSA
ncbi:MAG TPA: DUF4439 domain-containing protein [Dermatophilaceae bacterium]